MDMGFSLLLMGAFLLGAITTLVAAALGGFMVFKTKREPGEAFFGLPRTGGVGNMDVVDDTEDSPFPMDNVATDGGLAAILKTGARVNAQLLADAHNLDSGGE